MKRYACVRKASVANPIGRAGISVKAGFPRAGCSVQFSPLPFPRLPKPLEIGEDDEDDEEIDEEEDDAEEGDEDDEDEDEGEEDEEERQEACDAF